MNTKTTLKHIYTNFSEHKPDGIGYLVFDECTHKSAQDSPVDWDSYKYLCPIELPTMPQDEIVELATRALDRGIAGLQSQINAKLEKKQQMLAICSDSHKDG